MYRMAFAEGLMAICKNAHQNDPSTQSSYGTLNPLLNRPFFFRQDDESRRNARYRSSRSPHHFQNQLPKLCRRTHNGLKERQRQLCIDGSGKNRAHQPKNCHGGGKCSERNSVLIAMKMKETDMLLMLVKN